MTSRSLLATLTTVLLATIASPQVWASSGPPGGAHAARRPPPSAAEAVTLPPRLTLAEAVRLFRRHGFDLLLADAARRAAEGDVEIEAQMKNPTAKAAAGRIFNYSVDVTPCSGCSLLALTYGMTDGGATFDVLSGKRGARIRAALAALEAVKAQRADVERVLVAAVKQQYVEVVLREGALGFARETRARLEELLEVTRARYPSVIDAGELARVETSKLEGDQAVTSAALALQRARIELVALLGARAGVPDFEIDREWLTLRVPPRLESTNEGALVEAALSRRPGVFAAAATLRSATDARDVAARERFPDVTLGFELEGIGSGQDAPSETTLLFRVETTLPVFHQRQGELRRADAAVRGAALSLAMVQADTTAEVSAALAAYELHRRVVERARGRIVPRAAAAREVLAKQYAAGEATLSDLLDAERQLIATRLDELEAVGACWAALFDLERALATELVP